MHGTPIRAHVEPDLFKWLTRWMNKEGISMALVVRKSLRMQYEARNAK